MSNRSEVGHDFLKRITSRIEKIAALVGCTLGPRGRNVIIQKGSKLILTKDGHTVAKSFSADESDPMEKMGEKMVSDVTSKTVDAAGDGTTTATVLFNAILQNAVKYHAAGMSPSEISAGIKCAADKTVEILSKKVLRIDSEKEDLERIIQVATISANGDRSIGVMIGDMIRKVGSKGIITVQKGNSVETTTDSIDGMRFDNGFLSRAFVSDQKSGRFEFEDANVLVYDKKLDSQQDFASLASILEKINMRPLLVICEGVDGYALRAIAANNIAGLTKLCVVKAPGYGDSKKENCEDIALFCGGTFISEEFGKSLDTVELEDLGRANVIVDDSKTTILNGNGNEALIEEQCEAIKNKINDENTKQYIRERLEKRLGNLKGKAGVINVGGMNDLDQERKMAAIDDALKAVQAAVEQGVLPGGGSSYIRAKKELLEFISNAKKNGISQNGYQVKLSEDFLSGMSCIADALTTPIKQSLANAGMEDRAQLIINDIDNNPQPHFGFNIAEAAFCDMLEAGIIDPYLCVTSSLSNAGHYVADAVSAGGVIYNVPKLEKDRSGSNMDMDGMF